MCCHVVVYTFIPASHEAIFFAGYGLCHQFSAGDEKKDRAAESMAVPTQYREASSEAIVAELRFPTLSLLLDRFFSVSINFLTLVETIWWPLALPEQ